MKTILLLSVILFTAWSVPVCAQKTSFPQGIQVECFFSSGDTVYAGTIGHGVYRSTDEGASWTQLIKGFPANTGDDLLFLGPTESIQSFCKAGKVMVANTGEHGLYRLNPDNSWTPMNKGLDTFKDDYSDAVIFNAVMALQCAGSNMYLLASDYTGIGKLYILDKSTLSWNQIAVEVCAFTANENNVFIADKKRGLFRSNDNGNSWVEINNGYSYKVERKDYDEDTDEDYTYMETVIPEPKNLFCSGTFVYVESERYTNFVSADNGNNWAKSSFDTGTQLFDDGSMLLEIPSGVILSYDHGLTWKSIDIDGDDFETDNYRNFSKFGLTKNYLIGFSHGQPIGVWRFALTNLIEFKPE